MFYKVYMILDASPKSLLNWSNREHPKLARARLFDCNSIRVKMRKEMQMFGELKITAGSPAHLQIGANIRELIENGSLRAGVRLPSTRELARMLKVSRNTVMLAYEELQNEEWIRSIPGQGAYVNGRPAPEEARPALHWEPLLNDYGKMALDLVQTTRKYPWRPGMISFHSLAPDESIFDVEDVKRAFLNRISLEGEKLLNYGEGKGYRPLIGWLKEYLAAKGVDFRGKDLLITSGFTEGFTLVVAALTNRGDRIVCENPTHFLALNAMKLAGLQIAGIEMGADGIDPAALERTVAAGGIKLGFIMPSYHNPTGLVMPPDRRFKVLEIFEKYRVPLVEEGFNEELRYSGSHTSPLIGLAGTGNHVICLGSFAKILFPAIRIGWVIGDAQLIACLESIKLHRNLHTSLLDQAVLYDYLREGHLSQYLKKAKRLYKGKFELAMRLAGIHIPCRRIRGEGGLHLFIELDGISARELLDYCYERGVLFTPGDIFYCNGLGEDALRISISRVGPDEMEQGFQIIGAGIRELKREPAPTINHKYG